MGLLKGRQKTFEHENVEIYKKIVATENSLIEENRTEIRTNIIKLECHKELLEKDLVRIVSEMPQQENEWIELEQKLRKTLADVSAILLEAWNYSKINGPLLNKEIFHIDLEPEILSEFEEAEKESKESHRKLGISVSSIRNKKKKSSEKLKEKTVYETRTARKPLSQEETSHIDHIDIDLAVSSLISPKNKEHNPNKKSLSEITEDTSNRDKPKETIIKESRKKVASQIDHNGSSTRDIASYTQATCCKKYTR